MQRAFRFAISMPPLGRPPRQWRDEIRRIEDTGFSSVAISDHLSGGWAMDPIVAMTVAAETTTRLRVLSMVFCNDLRHPVLLHKSMANLDVFSGGRVEIGLGAGWLSADYDAVGRPFDRPAVRIERLAEAVDLMAALFGEKTVTFTGRHYRVSGLDGLPKPVQRPHPPLAIGGGGRKILELAGRAANIIGINPQLSCAGDPGRTVAELSVGSLERKLAYARAAARAAGRKPDQLEIQLSMLDVRVSVRGTMHRSTSSLAAIFSDQDLADSPAVLRGDVDACVDRLVELRERYGINYVHLGGNLDAAAPIVTRLASG